MNATEIFYSNIIIFSSNERMIEVCWADICFSILSISLLISLSFEFTFIFFLPLLLDCFFGAQKSASRKTSRSRSHIFMLTSASDHQCAALNKEVPPVPYYVDSNNLTDFPQLINWNQVLHGIWSLIIIRISTWKSQDLITNLQFWKHGYDFYC